MKIFSFFSNLSDWRTFVDSDTNRRIRCSSESKSRKWKSVRIKDLLNTESNKYDIFISALIFLLHIFPFLREIRNFWNWNIPHYVNTFSAWLMTYDGGFIRRGIPGEFIKFIEMITGVLPHKLILLIALTSFAVLFIWVLILIGSKLPLYFILSPVFFALATRYGAIFYMDYILLLIFLCSLKIIISNNNKTTKIILINLISTLAILIHEVYFFVLFPILVILYNLIENNSIFSKRSLPLLLLPVIAMVLVIFNSHHSVEMATHVLKYWNEVYRQHISEFGLIESPPYFTLYIDTWYEHQLPHVLKTFKTVSYGIFWNPIVWILLWYYCGLFSAKIISHYDSGKENTYLLFYYFSSFFSLPLYFLAWDYGRWILFSSISSILVTYSITPFVHLPDLIQRIKIRTWKSPLKFWQKILIITSIGIPAHWHNPNLAGLIYPSPIWYPLHFYIDFASWP